MAWPPHEIGRRQYLIFGLGLFAVKLVADVLVARAFERYFNILFYISPLDSPLLNPGEHLPYWLTMWAVALPFIVLGVLLTMARLRDAGVPPWLVVLFFVPFANLLFFLTCAILPTRETTEVARTIVSHRRGFLRAAWIAAACGAVVGLGAALIGVRVLGEYGAALFIGAPFLLGFTAGLVFAALHPPKRFGPLCAAMIALGIVGASVLALSLDGVICVLMAAPIAIPEATIGAYIGNLCGRTSGIRPHITAGSALSLLPCLFLLEATAPLPRPPAEPVETIRYVAAPPATVWKWVIAFPPIEEPRGWMFRAGIAAPLDAHLSGEGVGAIRECRFTTGSFIEPIEVWSPGHELTFTVTSQPDPMREMVLWDGPRPPHLDGFLESTRGQFLLEPLPGGGTKLTGRTWYRTNMVPEPYWRLWADPIIHTIHQRVLDHVARLAEEETRRGH